MRSERGVALVLVLVILPLVAIIMVQLHFETTIGNRLAQNVLANQQFKAAIAARRRQIRLKLVKDLVEDEKNSQAEGGAFDHYSDLWGPDTEGGSTALIVSKGDEKKGDKIDLYTEVVDEQGKFNVNLLRHSDPKRRARAHAILVNLLDFFRESRFKDLEENEFDLNAEEAKEVANAILKFTLGEERDERTPKSDLPQPSAEMKQGLFTISDLRFCHRLFGKRRLLERFTDPGSGQRIPSLGQFLTVYGDGKINANTAPVQLLRALFIDAEGQEVVAAAIFKQRGGFLADEESQDERREKNDQRRQLKSESDEQGLQELDGGGFKTVNDILQVQGMNEQGFLRRNEIDVGQVFTTRSMFFSVTITAKRGNFMRQHRVVLQRHSKGTTTWESEVRSADLADLPQGIPGAEESGEAEG